MKEALVQSIQNLRANKLRSLLTMFGILWGMISVVVLSATGEGFRRGNDKVLRELGKNIAIVWGGRTSLQAGGERAGRSIQLTLDDARAIAAESSMIAVVSPEIERSGVNVKSAYNAATARVTGIEPQYQDIRTIELQYGRNFTWKDEEQVSRVAIIGADMADQLFGKRSILNEPITLNGAPYTVVGKIRKKNQDSNYSGPDNNKIFVPFAAMSRDMPRLNAEPGTLSDIIVAPKDWVVDLLPRALDERTGRIDDIDWPFERNVRAIIARRHGFDPEDKQAIATESSMVAVVSPELQSGGVRAKSAYNAASVSIAASSLSTRTSAPSSSPTAGCSRRRTKRRSPASPSSALMLPTSCSASARSSARR